MNKTTPKTDYTIEELFQMEPEKYFFWLGEQGVMYHEDGKDWPISDAAGTEEYLELFPGIT